jgi:hypothetical protein
MHPPSSPLREAALQYKVFIGALQATQIWLYDEKLKWPRELLFDDISAPLRDNCVE